MIERIPARVLDVGVTAVVTLLTAGNALSGDHHPLVVTVAVAGAVVLLLRRRRPLLVLALVAAAALALAFAGTQTLLLSLLVAFYSVGSNAARRTSLYAAAAALALVAVGVVMDG